jgi:hypothetical protein
MFIQLMNFEWPRTKQLSAEHDTRINLKIKVTLRRQDS